MAATETNTELRVDFLTDMALPGYGAVWEAIGRGDQAFHLVGNRGEQATVAALKFFADRDQAYACLEQLDEIRDNGYPFALTDGVRRIELFLHRHNEPVVQQVLTSDGTEYLLRLTLTVTRTSRART